MASSDELIGADEFAGTGSGRIRRADFPVESPEERARAMQRSQAILNAEGGIDPVAQEGLTQEEWSKRISGAGRSPASRRAGKSLMSVEEFAGATEEAPAQASKGFMANIRPITDWPKMWTEESLPANLYQAYRRGVFNQPISELIASGKAEAEKFDFKELVKHAKSDPGGFAAELINAIVTDPELLLTPAGLGGSVASRMASAGMRVGARTAGAANVAGRAVEAGVVGGAAMGAIEGAQQAKNRGEIKAGDVAAAAELGGVLGAGLRVALGGGKDYRAGVRMAQTKEAADAARAAAETAELQDILAPTRGQYGQQREPRTFDMEGGQARLPSEAPQLTGPQVQQVRQLNGGSADPRLLSYIAFGVAGGLTVLDAYRRYREGKAFDEQLEKEPIVPTREGTMFGDLKPEDLAPLLAIGAVKGKGGMWHPGAVTRLVEPLAKSLTGRGAHIIEDIAENRRLGEGIRPEYLQAEQQIQHTQRMVRNWLNKHAGTETDPLKDVEIPVGTEMRRWEDVTDKAFFKGSQVNPRYGRQNPDGTFDYSAPQFEPVFDLSRTNATKALTDYLSHVGDYLRQNVALAPEEWLGRNPNIRDALFKKLEAEGKVVNLENLTKEVQADPRYKRDTDLSRYDLVRAVRETAEADRKAAAAMEKSTAASMKDLPVYKEYPQGFKWVELKLPEKLTEEQRGQVKQISKADGDGGRNVWQAVDSQGKPIRNTFTGEEATAYTPEEAWLAGQLAQEGNQMGHCVGGYCEGVAAGESRIFSLRDPKGKSHVTVEVAPNGPTELRPEGGPNVLSEDILKRKFGARGADLFDQWRKEGYPEGQNIREFLQKAAPDVWEQLNSNDILQIKGKQNRAPVVEYLPYVQDFVRSGKWGEVGDLENTGLSDITQYKQLQENYRNQITHNWTPEKAAKAEELFKKRFLDKEEMDWLASGGETSDPFSKQRGFADPKHLARIAAIAGGAIAGANYFEDSLSGAALGAIAAGLGIAALPGLGKGAGRLGGLLSTSLRNIHPSLQKLGRDYELGVLTRSYDWLVAGDPFLVRLNKLGKDAQRDFKMALLNGDEKAVKELLKGLDDPKAFEEFQRIRDTLDTVGSQLRGAGRFKEMIKDYFPRLVKDPKGLMEALGSESKSVLERKLAEAEKDAMSTRGTGLSELERSAIINKHLAQTHRQHAGQPGWAKLRKVGEVTEELEPFYASPTEAYHAYVRSAAKDIERAKFFGRDLALVEKNGQRHINVPGSIGNMVERLVREKKIQPEQVEELTRLLENRMQTAELGLGGKVQDFRNITNAALLGNPISASVQLGDLATAVFMHGLKPTLGAVVRIVTGRPRVRMSDFGLVDHISEEFVSMRGSAKFLNAMLKYSGFSLIDTLGKNANLNAALTKYQRWAQTSKGVEKIARKYGEAYGDAFPQLVADLRQGEITPHVRSLLFQELSDVQPISPLEMPFGYHESKKLQSWGGAPILAYQLKSFVLKQIDIVRRESFQEIRKGNVARGVYNLARYSLLLGAAGASTDMLRDWLLGRPFDAKWTDVPMNVLKTFGLSQYVLDKAKGEHGQPEPLKAFAGVLTPPYKIMDDILAKDGRAVKYIPLIGALYWNHRMGGAEKYQEQKEKRERAAERRREKEE